MKRTLLVLLGLLLLAASAAVQAQSTGITSYHAIESWTVTIAEDNGETPTFSKTYHGTETGTLVVTNPSPDIYESSLFGTYSLIDKTGLHIANMLRSGSAPSPATWHTNQSLNDNRSIYVGSGGYSISGSYPVAAFAGDYAIVQLSFFVVAVKLPVSSYAIPVIDPYVTGNDIFATTGSTLDSMSGAGDESDSNTGFTASAYSTSSLTPSGGAVKYTVTVFASPPGSGRVTGGGNFKAGTTHAVNASPASGATFSDWTDDAGDVLSTQPKYSFVVDGDMDLTANFVPNPFTVAAGVYSGLFSPASGSAVRNSGYLSLAVTSKGKFSGYLETGSTRHSITGQFDDNGGFTGNINVSGQSWTVSLNLNLSGGNDLGGTVNDGTWTAGLTGNKAVFNASKAPASQAGRYTMIFAGTNASTTLPAGNGYATVSINKAGTVTLAGSLADGSKITQSATLSQSGEWPLYAPLYKGQGCLFGWMSLNDSGNVSGNVVWIKPDSSSSYYPGGFTFLTTASGGSYTASDAISSFNFTQKPCSAAALYPPTSPMKSALALTTR